MQSKKGCSITGWPFNVSVARETQKGMDRVRQSLFLPRFQDFHHEITLQYEGNAEQDRSAPEYPLGSFLPLTEKEKDADYGEALAEEKFPLEGIGGLSHFSEGSLGAVAGRVRVESLNARTRESSALTLSRSSWICASFDMSFASTLR